MMRPWLLILLVRFAVVIPTAAGLPHVLPRSDAAGRALKQLRIPGHARRKHLRHHSHSQHVGLPAPQGISAKEYLARRRAVKDRLRIRALQVASGPSPKLSDVDREAAEAEAAIREAEEIAAVSSTAPEVPAVLRPQQQMPPPKPPVIKVGTVAAAGVSSEQDFFPGWEEDSDVGEAAEFHGRSRGWETPEDKSSEDDSEESEKKEEEEREEDHDHSEEEKAEDDAKHELAIAKKEDDKSSSDAHGHQVDEMKKNLLSETKSRALADMLGSLKKDIYLVDEKLDDMQDHIEDGVTLEPEDPAKGIIYPLSTCLTCIIILSTQYVLVYTAAAFWRAVSDFFGIRKRNTCMLALRGGCDTVFYAPMLCVLFIGTELRALQISQGAETTQASTQLAMKACSWSVFIQTCLVLAYPIFTGEAASVGRHVVVPSMGNRQLYGLFTLIRYLAVGALYIGLVVVYGNTYCMDTMTLGVRRFGIWDDPTTINVELAPPLSSAMTCIMVLTATFFIAHLVHSAACTCVEIADSAEGESGPLLRASFANLEIVLRRCSDVVNVAPMVCVLFVIVRMRALQLDPSRGEPQGWAVKCFYVITGSIFVHLASVVAYHCFEFAGAESPSPKQEDEDEEEYVDRLSSPLLFNRPLSPRLGATYYMLSNPLEPQLGCAQQVTLVVRCLTILAGYAAALGVVGGVWRLEAPSGLTPALSSTSFCVIGLAAIYLAVYLGLYIAQVVQLSGAASEGCAAVVRSLRAGEYTVKLCPMLGVFFVGARIRALQLTGQQGAPQCWAQDAMYVSSAAVVVQLIVALTRTAASDDVGSGGDSTHVVLVAAVRDGLDWTCGRIFVEIINAFAFLGLYGGALVVAASTLAARPETARCYEGGIFFS